MKQLNVYQAKSHFSQLLEQVAQGESVTIAKAGRPVARLIPLTSGSGGNGFEFGCMAGEITITDDFDAPLPDDMLALFEGGDA